MQRKFLTNLGLLLLLNLLIKPFWVFGIDRTVQNIVGSEDFGFYFTVLNFSFLFNILLDFGITNFNNRNIAQNTQLLAKHFSRLVTMKLVLGFLYFLVTLGFGYGYGYRGSQLNLLALVGFNQFLLSFILYLRSNISGMLMFRTESIMSVLDRLLMIVIMVVLLWGNITTAPFKIEWFVYAQTVSYIIALFVAYLVVVIKSKSLTISWDWPFFLMIMRKSMPFALLTLLMTIYNRIDTVMMGKLLSNDIAAEQAGIYAHGYRILDATNQISFLFAVFLLPLFSHMIKQGQELLKIIKISFSILIVATGMLAVTTFFYSYEFMDLLYEHHIDESGKVYATMIFGIVAMSTSYIFGTLLTANGNMKALNIIAGISVVISFVLNYTLVPAFMAKGAAIANLSALSFSALAQLWVVHKEFNFKPEIRFTLRLLIFWLIAFLLTYLSRSFNHIDWILRIGILFLIMLILAFALRLFNIKELFSYLETRELS
jgi:O-antigen/teichoic acid export membrane protein